MKITPSQLRHIIAEEVKKARLNEAGGTGLAPAEVQALLDAVYNEWESQYNSDVRTSRVGADWTSQCESAREYLGYEIETLITRVKKKLDSGAFFE